MEKLHPIIRNWITTHDERRRRALASENEWVRDNAPPPLSETDHRRHKITNRFLRELEVKGLEISEQEKNEELQVTINGEHIKFRIREKCRQQSVLLRNRRDTHLVLVGTGKLVFELRTYLRGPHNEEWKETDSHPSLDHHFPKIIERMFEGAKILKAWRQEIDERQERQRQAAIQQAKVRLAKLETSRREKLLQLAFNWKATGHLRELVAHIRSLPGLQLDQEINGKTLGDWLSRAESVAEALDPLGNGGTSLFKSISSPD